ncbi:type VI secretion system secreted protein VgrG [Catalinimonas alkaloidigena]|uniref:type VI secretion system Vgr family protein n=1 Tax=Catalinimonas alkaloidigena TaxID=1075417 RepID=UPI002405B4B9|nr:contractile injection system protein, VgrG/Pvc8 family [Catalinimonas alkaloidigena]MDF9798786.1 type VI secretion system secreted protein VgrG [Catalinimonas alkaloidigena]
MAHQVKVNVTIAGKPISPIADLDISQSLFDHNVIQVVIPLNAFKDNNSQILNQAKDYLNQPLTAEITSGVFNKLKRDFSFKGIVTDIRMTRSQRGERMIFVTAHSPTVYLSGVATTRSFHEMTLADIVNQLLEDVPANMSAKVDPRYTENIEYAVQYRETNMQFLQRLADTYGEWLYYDGDEFIFGAQPSSSAIDLLLEKDLQDMKLSMRVVPVNFKAKAYDYLKHEVYESRARPGDISDLDTFGNEILNKIEPDAFSGKSLRIPYHEFQSADALDDYVRHEMATRSRDMVVLSGTTDHTQLRVGSVINITGEKANEVDLEKFIITAINHSIDESFSYSNTIQAIPDAASSPPDNPRVRIPFCEAQQATVIENDDPEGMGRVKVQFKWQDSGSMTPWVRMMQPYAGQSSDLHGFFFTPEIEDEVIVGFINDNPELPYVMGSVFHNNSSNHPKEWHNSDTNRKVIRTRSGNQIHFVDENDKEEIIITNDDIDSATNEIRLSMEGDGKITIMTLGALDIQANSITMNADEDIDIKAGANASLDVGQGLEIKSGTDTKMEAGTELNVKSGTDTKVEAGTAASVKGGTDLNLEGGIMSSLKGGVQLDLDGGPMASLKGALVKIN